MTSDSVGLSNPVWKCVSNECEGLNVAGLSHNSKRRDGVMERSVCAESPVSTVSTHKNGPGL
jgi:hypothetical protein